MHNYYGLQYWFDNPLFLFPPLFISYFVFVFIIYINLPEYFVYVYECLWVLVTVHGTKSNFRSFSRKLVWTSSFLSIVTMDSWPTFLRFMSLETCKRENSSHKTEKYRSIGEVNLLNSCKHIAGESAGVGCKNPQPLPNIGW